MMSSDDEGLGWLGRWREVGHGHGRRQHDSDDSDESPGQLPDRRPAAPVHCSHGVTVIMITAAALGPVTPRRPRGWRGSDGIRVADSGGPAEVTRPRRAPNALAVTRGKPRRARAAGQTKRLCARVVIRSPSPERSESRLSNESYRVVMTPRDSGACPPLSVIMTSCDSSCVRAAAEKGRGRTLSKNLR
jgi:hypothetical protein